MNKVAFKANSMDELRWGSTKMIVKNKTLVRRLLAISAVATAAAATALGSSTARADGGFTDDSMELRYSTKFKEPGVANGADITKEIVNFTHFNTDKYGSNFLSIDALFSHSNDPAAGSTTQGATEFYAVYRRDWSLSALFGTHLGVPGFIRDYALHMGGDANSKNTGFAPEKKLLVVGPEVQFDIPKGFLNVSLNYSKEWNYNGIVSMPVNFKPAIESEIAWSVPLGQYVSFNGFFNIVGPKGRDGFGNQTATEILTRPELMLDVAQLAGYKPKSFEVGVAYEYWHNKFGNDANCCGNVGVVANTPEVIGRVHF